MSSVLSREGAARREEWGSEPDLVGVALLLVLLSEGDTGGGGSGFTVMLDRALSVLEPVMELKRELASFRGIVAAQQGADVEGQRSSSEGRFRRGLVVAVRGFSTSSVKEWGRGHSTVGLSGCWGCPYVRSSRRPLPFEGVAGNGLSAEEAGAEAEAGRGCGRGRMRSSWGGLARKKIMMMMMLLSLGWGLIIHLWEPGRKV